MRNSELMRRRANVSTLDLGRIKSDREAIGEISQEEKDGHSFSGCMYHFAFFPPSSKMTYLCTQKPAQREWLLPVSTHILSLNNLHPPMHVQLLVWSVSLPRRLLCSFYGLLRTQQGSVSTEEFVKEDRPSSSHVSAAALQHHNRTHLKF